MIEQDQVIAQSDIEIRDGEKTVKYLTDSNQMLKISNSEKDEEMDMLKKTISELENRLQNCTEKIRSDEQKMSEQDKVIAQSDIESRDGEQKKITDCYNFNYPQFKSSLKSNEIDEIFIFNSKKTTCSTKICGGQGNKDPSKTRHFRLVTNCPLSDDIMKKKKNDEKYHQDEIDDLFDFDIKEIPQEKKVDGEQFSERFNIFRSLMAQKNIDPIIGEWNGPGIARGRSVFLGSRGKPYYLSPGGNRIYVTKNIDNVKSITNLNSKFLNSFLNNPFYNFNIQIISLIHEISS
ncbi:hypothetical protein BpHYR1_034792 [Brachionus plicatilis]|uniref:Uncharacterized protein n=1 Tax=Brachionus plicatilis TaxID=10195 RepID=A0A3M7QZ86_BRAPC|nr:hypothetical protein BpHYR1_034792 [Brachionus plicatilis]